MLYRTKSSIKYILGYSAIFFIYLLCITQTHYNFGQDVYAFQWLTQDDYVLARGFHYPLRHVGYLFTSHFFYKFWRFFGWANSPKIPLHLLSSIFGAGGVIIFYLLIKKIFKDKKFSLVMSLFFAFSFGYWFFSTQGIQIIPSLFFRLIAILILFNLYLEPTTSRLVLISIFHSISIFFDGLSALFIPVVVIGIYFFHKDSKKIIKIKAGFLYILITFSLTVAIYFLIANFYYGVHSTGEIIDLITLKAVPHKYPFVKFPLVVIYLFQTISIFYNWYVSNPFLERLHQLFNGLLIFSLVNIFIYMLVWKRNIYDNYYKKICLFCLIWIFLPIPLYYYQEPDALEFYIALSPAIWILISIVLFKIKPKLKKILKSKLSFFTLIILFVFTLHNFFFGMLPNCQIDNAEFFPLFDFVKDNVGGEEKLIILSDRENHYIYSAIEQFYDDLNISSKPSILYLEYYEKYIMIVELSKEDGRFEFHNISWRNKKELLSKLWNYKNKRVTILVTAKLSRKDGYFEFHKIDKENKCGSLPQLTSFFNKLLVNYKVREILKWQMWPLFKLEKINFRNKEGIKINGVIF